MMNSKTLGMATLTLVIIVTSLAGCSKHASGVTNPSQAGPGTQQATNVPPVTWFAGPDPDDPAAGWQFDPGPFGGPYIPIPEQGWYGFPGIPGTMLSDDSL